MAKPSGKPRERTSSVTELADFAGVSRNTIYEWAKLDGYPRAPDGSVAKWDLCEWYCNRLVSPETDDEPGPKDSPALERLRAARASQEEIKLAAMRQAYMDRDWVHARLMEIASLLRQCGDQLQRQHGEDALQILDDAMTEIELKIGELGGESSEP
jgi:hypothetical protein